MAFKTLFIVTGDPRASGVPAEALRIAAGVGAWKKTQIYVYLGGPAILALSEFVDELVDEDNYTRYLPIFRDFGRPFYVEAGSKWINELGEASEKFEEMETAELARIAAEANFVLKF